MKVRMWLRRVVGPLAGLMLAAGVGAAPAEAVVIGAFDTHCGTPATCAAAYGSEGWTMSGDGTADIVGTHAGDWTNNKNNTSGPASTENYLPIAGAGFARLTPEPGVLKTMAIERAVVLALGDTLKGWSAFDDRECKPIDDENCFNDKASVDIIQGSTVINIWNRDSVTTPVSGTLTNASSAQCISFFSPGGEDGCGDDPWFNWTWASTLTGGATLRFSVTNAVDNGKDSYAVLDQVEHITSAVATPLPGGLLLIVAGVTLGGLMRRRRTA